MTDTLVDPHTTAPQISVIVPTYCEAQNLAVLVPKVATELKDRGYRAEILIVDDDSPDETKQVCENLSAEYPVRLLVRTNERGLSSAVVHGLQQAQGDIFVVMDADLSHPPDRIVELAESLLESRGDFAIGSRYVSGGSTDEDWGLFRWLNSKIATWMAWPLTSAKDPMAGFFAIRRETFESAVELDPIGYKIGLELIVKCRCQQIREIPIVFRDRLHGESKLSFTEQINYIRHLKRLYGFRLKSASRNLQFGIVGTIGTVVDLATFSTLLNFLDTKTARAISIGLALTFNFFLHRKLTVTPASRPPILRPGRSFFIACFVAGIVNWSVSLLLIWQIAYFRDHEILAAMVGIAAGIPFNCLFCKYREFRDPVHSGSLAQSR